MGKRHLLIWIVLIILALSLAGCSSAPAGESNPAGQGEPNSPAPTGAQSPDNGEEAEVPEESGTQASESGAAQPDTAPAEKETPEQIEAKWKAGPHAQTYVLDSTGKNSSCARCHAPVNWIPTMDDMPESCYACKFEVKPAPPLIEESSWTHVECKICHEVKKKEVQAGVSWLEIAQIEQYAAVASVTELCLKCHVPVDVVGHAGVSNAGAHSEMVCSDCHDAHSMTASCSDSGCHEALEVTGVVIPGHDTDHANVSCSACHDASGLEIGPDEAGSWATFHPASTEGIIDQRAYTSHNTVREAPCERCHFADNPWGLNLVEASAPSN